MASSLNLHFPFSSFGCQLIDGVSGFPTSLHWLIHLWNHFAVDSISSCSFTHAKEKRHDILIRTRSRLYWQQADPAGIIYLHSTKTFYLKTGPPCASHKGNKRINWKYDGIRYKLPPMGQTHDSWLRFVWCTLSRYIGRQDLGAGVRTHMLNCTNSTDSPVLWFFRFNPWKKELHVEHCLITMTYTIYGIPCSK